MFTSKLPRFANSAKRPSQPGEGSTSIPVSVRKANLFTPQPNRSLHGTFSSTAKKSYLTTEKKYQRLSKPVPDRDEQMKMFSNLVDYLKTYAPGFPIPDPKKFLLSVSTTETTRIFEVLLKESFHDVKINKLEIDVPEYLTRMDYPYIRSVTKSALVSVTTRQAVGNLLVIFDWLVKQLRLKHGDPYESEPDEIFYELFEGIQPTENDDCQLILEGKTKKEQEFYQEIDEMTLQYEERERDAKTLEIMQEDVKKCDDYIEQMEKYCQSKRDEKKQNEERTAKLDPELADVKAQLVQISLHPHAIDGEQSDPNAIKEPQEQLKINEAKLTAAKIEHKRRMALEVAEKEEKEDHRCIEELKAELKFWKQKPEDTQMKLAADLKDDEENKRLQTELLKQVLEKNKQEMRADLDKFRRRNEHLAKVEETAAHNQEVVRAGMRLLFPINRVHASALN